MKKKLIIVLVSTLLVMALIVPNIANAVSTGYVKKATWAKWDRRLWLKLTIYFQKHSIYGSYGTLRTIATAKATKANATSGNTSGAPIDKIGSLAQVYIWVGGKWLAWQHTGWAINTNDYVSQNNLYTKKRSIYGSNLGKARGFYRWADHKFYASQTIYYKYDPYGWI